MAGCCVVLLAPLMLALAAVIVVVVAGLLIGSLAFLLVGGLIRIKLKNTKYAFISNICLTIGIVCILMLLSVELPIISGVISLILGIYLIKKYDEWKLLLYYVPVMAILILLGIPQLQLIEGHIILSVLIFMALVIGIIFGLVWLISQGRRNEKPILLKEGYSLIFLSEATLSFLMYATMLYVEMPVAY